MEKLTVFDPVDFLGTDEDMAFYLEAAANDDDPKAFLRALRTAAKAKGMADLAAKAGMPRESLYRALSDNGNPSYLTLRKIASAFGMRFSFAPAM